MKDKKLLGIAQVSLAYASWGLLSLFWGLLSEVNSFYILLQRIIWSMVFMFILLLATKKLKEIKECFASKKKILIVFLSGILVSANWGIYIYAVTNGHVLDASLGYFIEPIIVAIFGMLIFREKLSIFEKITFTFSILGMGFMIATTKIVPIMSLLIAITFAIYAAVKKNLKDISPDTSLFMETLLISPLAIIFALHADFSGNGSIGVLGGLQFLLLPTCGIVTSIPLLIFNKGVRKIPFYLSGLIEYISPTLQFLIGLLYFKEQMDVNRFISFVLIWIGCCFTIAENILHAKNHKSQKVDALN